MSPVCRAMNDPGSIVAALVPMCVMATAASQASSSVAWSPESMIVRKAVRDRRQRGLRVAQRAEALGDVVVDGAACHDLLGRVRQVGQVFPRGEEVLQ